MADQKIFRRYEIKYRVDEKTRQSLIREMSHQMVRDIHGISRIQSLYYDTPDFLLARRSMEHPIYKEKIRLRSYGIAEDDTKVFLELKKKYQSVVYKRRIEAPYRYIRDGQEKAFLADRNRRISRILPDDGTMIPDDPTADCRAIGTGGIAGSLSDHQSVRELFNAFCRYRGLSPRVLLLYEREAFYDRSDHEFRVTFDADIRFRVRKLTLSGPLTGTPVLGEGMSMMEVKAGGAIPLWFVRLLTEYRLYKTSFSKYGTAYMEILSGSGRSVSAIAGAEEENGCVEVSE